MKMNIKGLVFVGFAAAVFASAANAAGDKIVTSKTYVDAKYIAAENGNITITHNTDTDKNEISADVGVKGIKAHGASENLTMDANGIVELPAEQTIGTGNLNIKVGNADPQTFNANAAEGTTVNVNLGAAAGKAVDTSVPAGSTSTDVPTTKAVAEAIQQVADAIAEVSSDIPTVNDAALTVKQGATTLGTFTANSNTATEINIPVPTAPNNSKITIYKNDGTTEVGSFTVDQSSAGSINLPADSDTIYTFDEGAVAGQFKYSTDGGSTWTQVTVHNAQVTDNMVQTIDSSSTSTTYPSAQAVYNFLSTPPTGVTCSDTAPCAFVLGSGAPTWQPIQQ